MKKYVVILTIFILTSFVLYNSVYFEDLDQRQQQQMKKKFNPQEAVDYFWKNELPTILNTAISLNKFDSLLASNSEYLIQNYGKSIGISSQYSFLVKGEAETNYQTDEEIPVTLPDGNFNYNLAIKYIFGNTARDAVGYFSIDDFDNTMEFNAVGTELNSVIFKKIKNECF